MTVLPDDGLSLAAEFPDATHDQWQSLVAAVLRKSGKDVPETAADDALATTLEDGLSVRPLYTARDTGGGAGTDAADPARGAGRGPLPGPGYPGFPPFVRGSRPVGGWDVRQQHRLPEPGRANEAVLADLENGVTSLWLAVGGAGVPVSGLAQALEGVYLDLAPVVLDAGRESDAAARELLRLYEERGVAREAARGNLGADPLGLAARTGGPVDPADAVELARLCHESHPGLRALTVDALPYHEAGASAAQELGASLATGVAYLRYLTGAGLSVEAACRQLEFRYAATADQFLTVAKLRVARRLWARVAEACGAGDAGGQLQHVVTSPVMMTRRDPYVNMLRVTIACLGAGVGGADAVTVLPFDHELGLPDAFARRIARNTSTILLEESHLGRVADPAGGSWYVERLTDELAHAAWEFFQELERAGGQEAALGSGLVGERLAATWEKRRRGLARRREPVTGVSEFPNLGEKPVHREPSAQPPRNEGGLPRVRRDEEYEALRARSDAHLAATGARPRVFLAALGPASAHTARLTFASNLFQAGGVEPVHDPVPVDAATVAEAFARSGADIACLCSGDALYEEQAEAVAAALKEAGASRVFLAGRPAEHAGVDEYVFAGCDAVAVLSSTLDRMGVAA
ncbi:methylmalonyl-CoA mutase family protein [Streptomyces sp. SP18CS02]|uniref:methylmalonyl-CoA mutase family protein n=1 Tax=Streptomyces sp. SP18CS02 TaxID=3002531 RepID=UPI002E76D899|nr:methylmalonyl-CoA mutase family protein [Streptomyces sp. SP18CS02]MEE1752062.1 methylmalonyl-CoA mutase family protein [Streptomyces sp. SP18CS02]